MCSIFQFCKTGILIFAFLTLLLFVCQEKQAYAETHGDSGPGTACGVQEGTITENPVCPYNSNPVTNSYNWTIVLQSYDGGSHQVSFKDYDWFCPDGLERSHGTCVDFLIPHSNTVFITPSLPYTYSVTRSPTYGSYCGTYQEDFDVTAVDGNSSCTIGSGYATPGAWGFCSTGVSCGYTFSGMVFLDSPDADGVLNNGEGGYTGSSVAVIATSQSNGNSYTANTDASNGTYSFAGLPPDTYSVSIAVPNNYLATTQNPRIITVNSDSSNNNFGIAPVYTISGNVFIDENRNLQKDPGEKNYGGATITLTGRTSETTASDPNGNYSFSNLFPGNYTVTITIPPNYTNTTPLFISESLGPDEVGVNFGIVRIYTISGNVFNDTNKDRVKDNGESNYTGGINVAASAGTVANNPDGTYTVSRLYAGSYTITLQSVPAGYFMVYPIPPSFFVTVGPGCTVNNPLTGTCNALDNIQDLNFAISNSIPWMQTYGLDVRFDNGLTDIIPPAPQYPPYVLAQDINSATPGILFIGDSTVDTGIWGGQVSSTDWTAGGNLYPEVFTASNGIPLFTSYQSILSQAARAGITPTPLTTIPGCGSLSNCDLPPNLQSGIYQANGNLTLNAYDFPANSNFVLLIEGTLTINGNLTTKNNATALVSASQDIVINAGVGAQANVFPLPAGQVQGIYSADGNVTINGIHDCLIGADKMLNMEGALIVNAAQGTGTFTNNRDLCGDNPNIPSFTIKERLDYLLNAPRFLMRQTTTSHEDAP